MKRKHYAMTKKKRILTPGRFIVLGFALVILIGAVLLALPISHNEGMSVSPIDALFTSTSCVCVTGLTVLEVGNTFSIFGRTVMAILIQVGGLGVTSIGVFLITLSSKKISMRNRSLVKEALNYSSYKGVISLVRNVILVTLFFEGLGALSSYFVFLQDYSPLDALGFSLFHSIASFNNAGFDVFGGYESLAAYTNNVSLNIITMLLIIFGGLGFYVIAEFYTKRSFRKLTLHSKVVISCTIALLVVGAVLLKLFTDISWLGAFFASTSARTAGFATDSIADFSTAGTFILIILMFIGASPGSTGGGIKTTTFFILIRSTFAYAADKDCVAFRRKIPVDLMRKAFVVFTLSLLLVSTSTLLLTITEPHIDFMKILFETVSAFGTVGLTTGITPTLALPSKIILILTMFIGRLGPFVMASIWFKHSGSHVSYVEENVSVG